MFNTKQIILARASEEALNIKWFLYVATFAFTWDTGGN